jgi:hypothetical protein
MSKEYTVDTKEECQFMKRKAPAYKQHNQSLMDAQLPDQSIE